MIRRFIDKLKAFFASFGEPKLDRPLTQTETAQLLQLSTGLIADGDLMSKESRDTLIRYGLATRLGGFQTWTEQGSRVLDEMRMIERIRKYHVEMATR